MAKQTPRERDLDWLVEHRSRVQRLLLDLYRFDQGLSTQEQRIKYHTVFGFLVGATFSLWRAVFLRVKNRSMDEITKDAARILQILIETNAVGFPQERETEQWMAGYHINNALFRIHVIYEYAIVSNVFSHVELQADKYNNPPFKKMERAYAYPSQTEWELAYSGITHWLDLLKEERNLSNRASVGPGAGHA